MKKLILLFVIFFAFAYSGDNWKSYKSKTGQKSKVIYNKKGKVKYLINSGVFAEYNIKVNKQNAENVVDQFFERNKDLFKIAKKDRNVAKVKQWKNKTHVFVNQKYKGVPVWANRTILTFDKNGKLLLCNSRISDLKELDADPVISQDEAIFIASREMKVLNPVIMDTAALYFYPFEDENGESLTSLVWNFSLYDEKENSNFYLYFVDAISGRIIERRSKIKDYGISGYVKGKVKPYHWDDTAVDVFLSDADVRITFMGGGSHVAHTNDNGYYYYSTNPYQNVGLTYMLKGPYFQFASGEGYQEYYTVQWGQTQYTYNFGESEAVNTFYHLNEMQKFYTSAPISFTTMNGIDIAVKIKLSDTYYKARFVPLSTLEIQIGRQYGKEWGDLADVAYHEYTHAVIYKVNGNHSIEDIAPSGDGAYAGAMDEGFSDYYACSESGYGYIAKFVTGITGLPRQIANNQLSFDQFEDVHLNGTVIGGACRDLRAYLDNDYMDGLVFDALQHETTNFEDFAVKLAFEHDNDGNLSNSIPDWDSFNSAFFSNHGIIFEANVPRPATFTVSISGPGYLNFKQQGTFTANASGGISPYASYSWEKQYDGSSTWENAGSGQTIVQTMNHTAFTLKVTVIDYEGRTITDTHYVDNSFMKKAPGDGDGKLMVPEEYSLGQNFPNPFNPTTTINYDLKESGFVRLNIYNVKGQVVKKLVNKVQSAGRYESTFDASSLPSGLYYYSLEAGSFKEVKKMILMK